MDYWDEVNALLEKNNRDFRRMDAKSNYYQLVDSCKVAEVLAFNIINLLDKLQFSACEMWIGSYFWQHRKVTQKDLDEINPLIPAGIESFSYYSDELTSVLLKVYQHCLNKVGSKTDTELDYHLYQSTSKELFCYRRGHPLVTAFQNTKS